ncbi:PEP-CTERM sorting domain-containing protein [Opitutaceae bacterium TAV4]|nr:PEP-CTERM sorting domain-containing protein [Opitutaceae bacterium TAV4]RRJ99567.1 PEP-CTERM sorting domain-containing protein [Opitutaceae bacterium TAV3]
MSLLKKHIPIVSLFFALVCAPLLQAETLVEETFNYLAGNLVGKNSGYGFNSAWILQNGDEDRWSVSDGVATIAGTGVSTVRRDINPISAATVGTFYFSFDVRIKTYSTPSGGFNDQLVFRTAGGADVFAIGIAYDSAGNRTVRTRYNNSDLNDFNNHATLAVGMTNTIVGKFVFAEGGTSATLTLWWNPVDETSTPFRSAVELTTPSNVTDISQLRLRRQDASGGSAASTTFDNIRIGTDWASATTSIPEPGTYAAVLSVLALGAVAWMRRRG